MKAEFFILHNSSFILESFPFHKGLWTQSRGPGAYSTTGSALPVYARRLPACGTRPGRFLRWRRWVPSARISYRDLLVRRANQSRYGVRHI
jgi:hypothetical protein